MTRDERLQNINDHRKANDHSIFAELSDAELQYHEALIDEHAPHGNDPWGSEIESGVPIPVHGNARGKYPFYKMNVGDSVFIPGKNSTQVQGLVGAWRRKGWKFTCRAVNVNGVDGCRAWRVK